MGETAAQIQVQIDSLDAAITAAETGQAYAINGRSVTRATLSTLYARRDVLIRRRDRINGTSPMLTRGVPLGLR